MLLALAPVVPRIAASAGIDRCTSAPGVALTFDDGPHPEGTPAVLELLAAAHVLATFFMVGEQVELYPDVAAAVAAGGHGIGVHCHRHRVQLGVTERVLRADLDRALAAVGEATAVKPRLHRPPFGVYSAAGLRVARAAGLTPLLWSRWGKDWRKWTTPERIARRATAAIRPGDVILLHDADHYSARDSWRHTAAALSSILAAIDGAGLRTTQPTGSVSAAAAVSQS